MLKNVVGLALAGLIMLSGCAVNNPAPKLRIITEDNPPFNFTDEKGAVTGQSTEIVNQILKATGSNASIELMPWAQGYELALQCLTPCSIPLHVCPPARTSSNGSGRLASTITTFIPGAILTW